MTVKNDELMDLHCRNVDLLKELKEANDKLDAVKAKEAEWNDDKDKLATRVCRYAIDQAIE